MKKLAVLFLAALTISCTKHVPAVPVLPPAPTAKQTTVLAASTLEPRATGGTSVTLTGASTATAGSSVVATATLAGSGGTSMGGLQLSIVTPAGVTFSPPTISPAFGAQGFLPYCGAVICMVMDLAGTPVMGDGAILTVPLNFAATAAPGNYSIGVSNILAVTNNGLNINGMAPGPPMVVNIPVPISPCDLNRDGVTNVADVQTIINAVINGGTCLVIAADGGCSVVTAQQLIMVVLGGACKF
jgi:hypothetical protein